MRGTNQAHRLNAHIVVMLVIAMLTTCAIAETTAPFLGISTVVNGASVGDSLPANKALLNQPILCKFTSNGDMYLADSVFHRIRKISATNNVITTIAGTGNDNYAGDGGLAINADLNYPAGVEFSSTGEMYIADSNNNVIRKVLTNGTIITIAGNPNVAYTEDGQLATNTSIAYPNSLALHPTTGELYFTYDGSKIKKIKSDGTIETVAGDGTNGFGGDGGLAINAQLNYPNWIVFNSDGELIFSDLENHRIRKISNNGTISTIAGSSEGFSGDGGLAVNAQFSYPSGITISSSGEIYISDSGNNRVRKIFTNGTITTIAGSGESGYSGDGGLAINAQFYQLGTVLVNSVGEVFIADSNNVIRKVSTDGYISHFAGGGIGDGGQASVFGRLESPFNLVFASNGDYYILDSSGQRVRKVSNGIITTFAGTSGSGYTSDGLLANLTSLYSPKGIGVAPNGDVYIGDGLSYRVRKVSSIDYTVSTVTGTGTAGYTADGVLAVSAKMAEVDSFGFNSDGELIFADSYNHRVRKIKKDGTLVTLAGTGSYNPLNNIGSYNGDNILATSAGLYYPFSIFVNATTNEIYIADSENYRIRKVLTNGTIITIAGTGKSTVMGDGNLAIETDISPYALTVNSIGEVIFSELTSYRIRKIKLDGTIETIAGVGTYGFSGDGGLATQAQLSGARGVAVDSNDNIYIADTYNKRIRKISLMCIESSVLIGNECYPTCNGILSTDTSVCSGRGQCSSPNNCTCTSPYYGSNCEKFNCNGVSNTSSQVCSAHGTCLSPDMCSCKSGYSGSNCEMYQCSGVNFNSTQVCSSHGMCSSSENCTCMSGYYGTNCELFDCYGVSKSSAQVCTAHGSCSSPDMCVCESGFYGNNCSMFNCSGTPKTSLQVCSSNGKCLSPDMCSCNSGFYGTNCESFQCKSGYSGSNCEMYQCFGVNFNSSQVCSSSGTCTSLDTCSCKSGFSGSNCEMYQCSGVNFNSSQVCSSHGMCSSPGNCTCTTGYYGANCDLFDCSGISSKLSSVCSSQGSCVSPGKCTCKSDYYGTNCELFDCYSIEHANSMVCSGHGNCSSPNVCTCTSGYQGTKCDAETKCVTINGSTVCSDSYNRHSLSGMSLLFATILFVMLALF